MIVSCAFSTTTSLAFSSTASFAFSLATSLATSLTAFLATSVLRASLITSRKSIDPIDDEPDEQEKNNREDIKISLVFFHIISIYKNF